MTLVLSTRKNRPTVIVRITKLPKVTRDDVLSQEPDLAWDRKPSAVHQNSDQQNGLCQFLYEGRRYT